MFEGRKVVVVTVNGDRRRANVVGANGAAVEPIRRCPANRVCEPEGKETHSRHGEQNDRDEPDFLSPSTLLFATAKAWMW
jgi:hypothetical protein